MGNNSTISVGSHVTVEVQGLRDHNGAYQNDAEVFLLSVVNRATGVSVVPDTVTLPIELEYVLDSDGNYVGQLPPTLLIECGDILEARLLAVGSQNYERRWTETIRVTRGSQ